jgi:plasmid maintenance system antidote protein VapI
MQETMFEHAKLIKGIHPGVYLARELKKRKISKGQFSLSIREYPQTFVAITKEKRRMNPALALRIEQELGLEEGFLMTLQGLYDMAEEKRRQPNGETPLLSRFRPTLFWDSDLQKLNWETHRRYIIRRVMERGNAQERQEILNFYGAKTVAGIHPVN